MPFPANRTLPRADAIGLWCEAGGFHIDPWGAAPKAVITHAHADRARPGCGAYLCSAPCAPLLQERFGRDVVIESLRYNQPLRVGEVSVSFHPAGHMLGSAQIRLENEGEVQVVSGDYKLTADPSCEPFELVRCHTFLTEAAFGLPVYRWPERAEVFASLRDWWRANREQGKCSVVFAKPLGEAQRVLAGLTREDGPIFCHDAVERMNHVYRASGVDLPATPQPGPVSGGRGPNGDDWRAALVVAPPSARNPAWLKRFGPVSTAFVSGWMRIRGTRRRRSIDRGFVLSDHADWPELQRVIAETGAERVLVTHGYRAPMVRWLEEQGKQAGAIETPYGDEREDEVGTE